MDGPADFIEGLLNGNSKPPKGAEAVEEQLSEVTVTSARTGRKLPFDLRARIRVPENYLKKSTKGSAAEELSNGIIFPYTPQISFEQKAEYNSIPAQHTNYAQYFYKNSGVSSITVTAKFTVQNSKEAQVYLSTKHLLSALTKMPYGTDLGAGSPPPICRLDAYGSYMLKNIPIVITSFRVDFPQDVDYFMGSVNESEMKTQSDEELFQQGYQPDEFEANRQIDVSYSDYNFVPTVSTFNISCQPLYSRREMLEFNVKNFLENYKNNTKYL